ncbi:MAG: sulfur carrier protein ThiS [Gemmatimonadota bacterium]|nr:sulfur carrier protein ThiS [Gemmatimonadota bacterium]
MTGTLQRAAEQGSPPATDGSVAVTVNGAERIVTAPSSISDLLSSLSLDAQAVVVEHNGVILRDRDSLPGIFLSDGDVVEIVHFVGGG